MNSWLAQLGWTLRTMFARRRTYIGFGAFVVFDLMVLGMMQSENLRDAARHYYLKNPGYSSPENFSGLTIAHFILGQSVTLLGSLCLALVAGDVVAGEVDEGTMRTTLSRPVSRERILLLRWISCVLYTCALVGFLAAMALVCGVIDGGTGNLLVVLPAERRPLLYAFGPGLVRYICAIPFLSVSLLTVTAIGFMFSCTQAKSLTATVATLSFYLTDRFLHDAPFFAVFKPFLLSTLMDEWIGIYRAEIPWSLLTKNCGKLLAIDFALVALGWWSFRRRDLKP